MNETRKSAFKAQQIARHTTTCMLRTIERFLDSVETDAQDPSIQPTMDWFEE